MTYSTYLKHCGIWTGMILLTSFSSMQGQDVAGLLTPEAFLQQIRTQHPVAQEADLIDDEANANLRMARGAFDPKAYGFYDAKQFDDKNYWQVVEGGVGALTPWGWELKGGYVYNEGEFLNREDFLEQGQVFLGISAPLLQGMFMDPERASLRQAKIGQQAAEAERTAWMNGLYMAAMEQYWEWSLAYAKQAIVAEAYANSRARLEAMIRQWQAGDKAGRDTMEASAQTRTWEAELQAAEAKWLAESRLLAAYLWENGIRWSPEQVASITPLDLRTAGEETFREPSLLARRLETSLDHPELALYDYKQAELNVERKLKREGLKPRLDINYNLLSLGDALSESGSLNPTWITTRNYKWGISFEFPLFLRKARGSLALTDLKINATALQRDNKAGDLENKLRAYWRELQGLENQIQTTARAVGDYQGLLQAEIIQFEAGESNLFMINSRQQKQIEAESKFVELKSKYLKTRAAVAWAEGTLWTWGE